MVSLRAITMDSSITYQMDSVGIEQPVYQADSTPWQTRMERPSNFEKFDLKQLNSLNADKLTLTQTEQKPTLILPNYEKAAVNTDWLTIVLFGTLVIFATIRYSYINYIKHLFISLVNYPTSVRLWQESNYPASHAAYRLDVIFYIIFSVFVFQTFNVFGLAGAGNRVLYYLFTLSGVLIYFFGKRFLYRTIGTLFETGTETGEYLFNMSNYNRTLGIVLIPLVALVSFSPIGNPKIAVFTGITIVVAFQLLLLQRGVLILLRKQFSILYLFLYLCSLEFLPLLLIY
ncbi:MAG TPA: DUF4271 domain-containing protein, partial [Draconibacterium sp.]|nr:DUF4271 domain-containing protein [Draconibacterium sp.]